MTQGFLELSAELNCRDQAGNTPWHIAAKAGQTSMMQFLLETGCDMELRNDAGCTAVHLAAQSGDPNAGSWPLRKLSSISYCRSLTQRTYVVAQGLWVPWKYSRSMEHGCQLPAQQGKQHCTMPVRMGQRTLCDFCYKSAK